MVAAADVFPHPVGSGDLSASVQSVQELSAGVGVAAVSRCPLAPPSSMAHGRPGGGRR